MDEPETTEFACVGGPQQIATAMVWKRLDGNFDSYYFCCETCGACSRPTTNPEYALEEAIHHVTNHPITPEEHHNG